MSSSSSCYLTHFTGDLSVIAHGEVGLAPHEDEGGLVRLNVSPGFLQPDRDVLEALHVAHVVSQDPAHAVAVIGLGDGAEPLLTRGVPQLQLNSGPALQSHQAGEEVHAHCRVTDLRKLSIGEIPARYCNDVMSCLDWIRLIFYLNNELFPTVLSPIRIKRN